ncbi:YfiR family protein [Denitromonas halophila]|uniref:YfiR family protein n=1 Tax=Denitromonas halophila TaxID=1629404 RepID=A0A557QZ57_9RHOO|nr:YfiR family protein [Denitromonas halophila]
MSGLASGTPGIRSLLCHRGDPVAAVRCVVRIRRILCSVLATLLIAGSPWLGAIAADEQDARRVTVGLNLFPALLAADQNIADKRVGSGPLLLLLIHRDEVQLVEQLAAALRDKGAIRGIPLRVQPVLVSELADYATAKVAGVFVAQRMGDDIDAVLDFSRRHQLLSFSPFPGDVERGVAAGISVSDRVLPYVNIDAVDAAGVRIKPFFLRIAERYDQR